MICYAKWALQYMLCENFRRKLIFTEALPKMLKGVKDIGVNDEYSF